MIARLTIIFLLLLCANSLAAGQDQPAGASPPRPEPALSPDLVDRYEEMAEELKEVVPQREITIKAVPAVQTKLFRADPKLLENKFVAQFALNRDSSRLRGVAGSDFGAMRLASEFIPKTREPLRVQLKYLLDLCPADSRPDKRMIDFLTSEDCDRDVHHTGMWRGYSEIKLTFRVFAPTAEEAGLRARAIIQVFDGGYSRPVQRLALEEGQQALEQTRKYYEELSKVAAAIAGEQDKLTQPSEISGDILTQLKAQKVMQTVEMAGLSARVKACDAMLADPKRLPVNTLQSISDMKVKAEIERVGIKEKLDQINAFIAEGNERMSAQRRVEDLYRQRSGLRDNIEANERVATSRVLLFDHFAPLDLPNNEITVGPIEWVSE